MPAHHHLNQSQADGAGSNSQAVVLWGGANLETPDAVSATTPQRVVGLGLQNTIGPSYNLWQVPSQKGKKKASKQKLDGKP